MNSGEHYFLRVEENADPEIFSDRQSKAGRYRRISHTYLLLSIILSPLFIKYISFEPFLNPRSLYLTPELWEMTGLRFWWSFLFETPFVLFRNFRWPVMFITVWGSLYYWVKSKLAVS